MKVKFIVLGLLVLGSGSPACAASAVENEFILLDKDKRQANLPSTDEYKAFHPGFMLSEDPTQKTQANGAGEDESGVQIIMEDNNAEKTLSLEELTAKFQAGEYDDLVEPLETLASGDNTQATEMLGVMYYGGKGVTRNAEKAFQYFSKAAEANSVIAQHHLGVMYFTGDGTAADPVKSLMWLHVAIAHYPDGAGKTRAKQDRDNVYVQLTRRDKERALEMAREWLSQRGEAHLLDFQ